MTNQKLDNQLNLAIDASPQELDRSPELQAGYNKEDRTWDLLVKYSGDLAPVQQAGASVTRLLNNYAVVRIPQSQIAELSALPQVEYIEKPKRLYFATYQARAASCLSAVQASASGGSAGNAAGQPGTGALAGGLDAAVVRQSAPTGLTGAGVLVGCADSGVDYSHIDFRNPNGTTRILRLWDQNVPGNPPEGYDLGTEYTAEQINEALLQNSISERYAVVPSRDLSGHGSAVLGIAAGNGASSAGAYRGVAYESPIIAVKLGVPQENGFPTTTELIQAVDYLIRQSLALGMPMAINISFGNSYGSHEGNSLLDTYLDSVSSIGKTVICVGSGNEGSGRSHASGILSAGRDAEIEFSIGAYEVGTNIQLWKSYTDRFAVRLISPSGEILGPLSERLGPQRLISGGTEILVYYGEPGPYSVAQEIYFDFIPTDTYLDSGRWSFRLTPQQIVTGSYDFWLPGGNVQNTDTFFFRPSPQITLTVPSTADSVISVGAYDSRYNAYADFSGRGYTRLTNMVKPDLVAPGVGIRTVKAAGGYDTFTGTSFAAPFVTGSAALLMQWGVIRGNDPYLTGEKVKAFLRRGARQLPGYDMWPNPQMGYGALCVADSFPGA